MILIIFRQANIVKIIKLESWAKKKFVANDLTKSACKK